MTDPNPREVIGGNNPPGPLATDADFLAQEALAIRANLETEHAALKARAAELLDSFATAPATVDNDEDAGKVAQLRKMLRECGTALETQRKAEKGWYDQLAAVAHGWFVDVMDPLRKALVTLGERETAFLDAKAKREAEARRAAEKAAAEKAAAAKREAEEAERQRKALADMAAKAKSEEEAARIAEAQADADAEAQRIRDAQLLAEAEVSQARQASAATPSSMARSQSAYGASSSLRYAWAFRVDKDKVDLEKLRPYLTVADLEKAIRAAIKAGVVPGPDKAQPIAGVEMFREAKSTNR